MSKRNATSQPPAPFIVEPSGAHTHSLIFLHGFGSNGETFGRVLLDSGMTSKGLRLPQLLPGARFIFPTSRRRRSTAFSRSMLTMWFDKARMDDPSYRKDLQLQGLEESAREILDLIRHERDAKGIAPKNIILGGLSQGCAMSLSIMLCLDYHIGGFVGMSGYLPFREDIDEALAGAPIGDDDDNPFADDGEDAKRHDPAVKASIFERDLLGLPGVEVPEIVQTAHGTPVFLGHSNNDDKVPCSLGEAMRRTVERAGYEVEWKCYQGLGHWYKIPDEIDDVVEFIRNKVGWEVASI
ncbi:phospholipase/carboxylesterase [Coniochaeta ligniaria NRRL 30616]|uniref:Phospholipase/carboxylesterase n=1 Tax=Coniochaeta ligniaria NRRL 30616 TaxID=1408157 RepID=A0A1J7I8Q0_9PEZI|nr:phospholipase/carboxylesterase [Coniochaeta ligniaria NRRL 30616]